VIKPFSNNDIDSGDSWGDPSTDPEISKAKAKLERQATIGLRDISQTQRGQQFAWSNTGEQLVELEGLMRNALSEGKYGPKYLRDYFITNGYGNRQITETFKKLTGMEFDDYLSTNGYVLANIPSTIPPINYGWGEAKNKEYDYYFIQPWNLGWAIFGQKGDLVRKEVSYEGSLNDARSATDKLVKELHYLDKPVDPKKLQEDDSYKTKLSEPKLIQVTASDNDNFIDLDNWIYEHKGNVPDAEIKSKIIASYKGNQINEKEFYELWSDYGFEKSAAPVSQTDEVPVQTDEDKEMRKDVEDTYQREMDRPFEDIEKEKTPSDFFDSHKDTKKFDSLPANVLDKITQYMEQKQETLNEFKIRFLDHKYIHVYHNNEDQEQLMGEELQKDFSSTNAVVSVIFEITDTQVPEPENKKDAIIVFNVYDGEILTSDLIKGRDNRYYALTEEGLNKYFSTEREDQI
jgi:hypothetical protein